MMKKDVLPALKLATIIICFLILALTVITLVILESPMTSNILILAIACVLLSIFGFTFYVKFGDYLTMKSQKSKNPPVPADEN